MQNTTATNTAKIVFAATRLLSFAALIAACLTPAILVAEVARIDIVERRPYAGGRAIADRGPYQHLRGSVHFAVDPLAAANEQIVDLKLAPRNKQGLVEFHGDVEFLAPVDLSRANGALLYDVNNRGNPIALSMFDHGADDFLLRQGYIVAWSGWLAEVLPGNKRFLFEAPPVLDHGRPIQGLVRSEFVVDSKRPKASIAHKANQASYRPVPQAEPGARLTMRLNEANPRIEIPRDQWQFHATEVEVDGRRGQMPLVEIELKQGLEPGYIYEVVYQAEGSLVQGAGMAGIRDLVSFLRYDRSERNPLRKSDGSPAIDRALGFGVSQSGRCLRQFLYDGFNTDESHRRVFDGLMPHVSGSAMGTFNHRFGAPTRTNDQHEEHLFAADYFPFTYGESTDPYTKRADSILRKFAARDGAPKNPPNGASNKPSNGAPKSALNGATDNAPSNAPNIAPKIMHTQSSSEYWHRSGSLVHTDPTGAADAAIPDNVRIYAFGGTQHSAGSGLPQPAERGALPLNPADYRPLLRALVIALDEWMTDSKEPPPSVYPTIADHTLVHWEESSSGWHALPSVAYPRVINQPAWLDRGPHWLDARIATIEPPVVQGHYNVRIPAFDADNNERGTLNLPALRVPVATYTSWNTRAPAIGAPGELLALSGGYIPLRKTAADRAAANDPRRALLERYQNFDDYQRQFSAAVNDLIARRYILAEEAPRQRALSEQHKPLFD